MTTDPHHVARGVQFVTPDGGTIEAETVWFRTDPPGCRILVECPTWERIAKNGILGVDTVDRSEFVETADVVLEATYEGEDFPASRAVLRNRLADPEDPLRTTNAWRATSVQQETPLPDETELTETSLSGEESDPRPTLEGFSVECRPRREE